MTLRMQLMAPTLTSSPLIWRHCDRAALLAHELDAESKENEGDNTADQPLRRPSLTADTAECTGHDSQGHRRALP